jgi:hypothetical protein
MAQNKKNLAQIVEAWGPCIKKLTNNQVNESTSDRYQWMCEYAHNHAMSRPLNEAAGEVGGAYWPVQNLLNTNGIGNPVPAHQAGQTAAAQASLASNGSGDKWPSLLPMALQVAARTIAFDLVNTVPLQGPTGVLPFLDYIYTGSKDVYGATPSYNGATANPQKAVGGAADAYKLYGAMHAFRADILAEGDASTSAGKKECIDALRTDDTTAGKLTFTQNGVTLDVQFIGLSRLSAQPMFKVMPGQETVSIGELFGADASYEYTTTTGKKVTFVNPRAISALEDQLQGFTGAGAYDSDRWGATFQDPFHLASMMDRATGEMQYPRQMSLKVFTKFVSVGTQSISISVSQEQVQDLQKQWGIDVVKLVENAAVNELSQSYNKIILSHLFAMGWKNHLQGYESEGINLNLDITKQGGTSTSPDFVVFDENGERNVSMPVNGYTNYGNFENANTVFNKIATTIMAAGNLIMQRGRRGPATFVVCNWKIASMLQANAQYAFAPIANTFNQNNGQLYPLGQVGGMTVYVDPLMATYDTRVLVGRKPGKDEPGLTFCPYIMADSIKLIAPETAAPKVIVKSRAALVPVGFYPELNYVTLYIKTGDGIVA